MILVALNPKPETLNPHLVSKPELAWVMADEESNPANAKGASKSEIGPDPRTIGLRGVG